MEQQQIDQLTCLGRVMSSTPRFFRRLRTIGIVLAAVGGAGLSLPVAGDEVVTRLAGYAAAIGSAISGVCQLTVKG